MRRLLLATNNRGKLLEMQALLAGVPFELLIFADIGINLSVEETGSSYAENAILKARAGVLASGMITLADDSGLEVRALGGSPGLHSARYSEKPGATDADRRERLLDSLAGLPRPWLARFCCTVAIVTPAGKAYLTEGDCSGEIIPEERGDHGFGYDPIFWIPLYQRTMAELSMEEKNQVSHRATAMKKAIPLLTELINGK